MIEYWARIIISIGLTLLFIGALLFLLSRLGFSGFKIPGDIVIRKGNFSFYFPLATMLILSLILTFILNFIGRR
ncbi:MAG: DUF2905 domain-containing protein [Syntrophomonadaceae bacterium]|nr:DUF2905 domain-containing protein [Syntrophomonadaceae bacterium]